MIISTQYRKKIEIATWASCNPHNIIHGLFQSCVDCYSVGWGYSGKTLSEKLQKLQNCVVRVLTPATKLVRLTNFLNMGHVRNSTSNSNSCNGPCIYKWPCMCYLSSKLTQRSDIVNSYNCEIRSK